MLRPVPWWTSALVVPALVALGSVTVRADDAPPAPIPTPPLNAKQVAEMEQVLGLHEQAEAHRQQGKFEEAVAALRAALVAAERVVGPDHPETGSCLHNLGQLLQELGDYAAARPLLERALDISEKRYGPEHPETAASLHVLATLLEDVGEYEAARPLFERDLAISEKALGPDHPDVAASLTDLALLHYRMGEYEAAKPRFQRALAISEAANGPDHPETAASLGNLAAVLQSMADFAGAMPLYERALAISEKVEGPDHPATGSRLNNLAALLQDMGDYARAKPLCERALAITEKAQGPEHPLTGTRLNNLAALLQAIGDYAGARPLYERALVIAAKAHGPEHPETAVVLDHLAALHGNMDDYAVAERFNARAIAISEKALGPEHPATGARLDRLGGLLRNMGELARALPLLERALAIAEKSQGPGHPATSDRLSSLGVLRQDMGDFEAAKSLLARALAISEASRGPEHPETGALMQRLAVLFYETGAYIQAKPLLERALGIAEGHVRAQLGVLGAKQRLEFMRATRFGLDTWLEFAPHAGLNGYAEVLRFRGIVARAESAERILVRHAGAEERGLQRTLEASQKLVARLANEMPPASSAPARATWQRRYAQAAAERERLTIELSRRCAPLRGTFERLTLGFEDIRAQLASEDALVDLLRVRDRYLAWLVRATGEATRIDVGEADAIDEACAEFIKTLASETSDPSAAEARAAAGAALRALVWAPIAAHLGVDVKRVVLVPDAALAAVPFAALPGQTPGRYLLDDLALAYLMQAQDLVPWKDAAPLGTGALLLGGVDYERAQASASAQPLPEHVPTLAALDRDARGGTFRALAHTGLEAAALKAQLGPEHTTLLLGSDATEGRLRADVRGKRFVHIATHGFAREDLLAGLYNRKLDAAWTTADMERQLATGHDPMLLSGLALAGANLRDGASGDDGILTALEASYLDLDGVDLVTLSACETAKGTAESGEGVLGLVSAFQMAGARHVIASLWKVDDEATRLLMGGAYERMLRPENSLSPAEALREAALALREVRGADGKARFAAPRYWAAFVAYGK